VSSSSNNANSGSTAQLSGNLTPAASDLIFCGTSAGAATCTAGSGLTRTYNEIGVGGVAQAIASEYQLNEASPINPSFSLSTSASWVAAGASFTATASSGPTTATLSGPTVGLIGVISTNFTITLDQAAQSGGVSCPITSSHGGDTITSTPVVITSGNLTGTFTVTPSPHNLGDVGTRNISLGTTTPILMTAGSPIAYLAQAYYPAALMLGL